MSGQSFQIQPQYGPYRVLKELGRGGQGVVLHARQDALSRDVALKLLFGQGERTRKRFVREAQTLAQLRHPNLPNVFDVGEAQGTAYIAMEHVRGESLKDYVRARGLPDPEWTRRILGQVARAVHFCHTNGVLHRDLKPSNILLEAGSERPVLIDFGLITIERSLADDDLSFADRTRLSLSGELKGTPHYMSPEQAHPDEGPVTPRSDVYSLGGVLYFLLTGREPFAEKDSIYAVLLALMQDRPVDPRRYAADAPADLVAVFERAMARQPADRYESAEELAAALVAAPRSEGSRNLALLAALLLGSAGVAFPLWALGSGGPQTSPSPSPAPSALAALSPPPSAPSEPDRLPPAPVAPRILSRPSPSPPAPSPTPPTPPPAAELEPAPTWITSARPGGEVIWRTEVPRSGTDGVARAGSWTFVHRRRRGWLGLRERQPQALLELGEGRWTWDAARERMLVSRERSVSVVEFGQPPKRTQLLEVENRQGLLHVVPTATQLLVGGRRRLTCCDPAGQRLWQVEHPFRVEAPPLPLEVGGERYVLVVDARGEARLLAAADGALVSRRETQAPGFEPLVEVGEGRVLLPAHRGRLVLLEVQGGELALVREHDLAEPLLGPVVVGPAGGLYLTGRSGLQALTPELDVRWHGSPVAGWGLPWKRPWLCDLDRDGEVEVAQSWGERKRRRVVIYDRGGAELLEFAFDEGGEVVGGPQGSLVVNGREEVQVWGAEALERPASGMNQDRILWQLMAGAWRRAEREAPRLGGQLGAALAGLAAYHQGRREPIERLGGPRFFDPLLKQALSRSRGKLGPSRYQLARLLAPFGWRGSDPQIGPLRDPEHQPWQKGPALGAHFDWRKPLARSNGVRVRFNGGGATGRRLAGSRIELRFELKEPATLTLRVSHKCTDSQGRQFAELAVNLDGRPFAAHLESSPDNEEDELQLPRLEAGEHVLVLQTSFRSLTHQKLNWVRLERR